ncbi:MAG: hypothetical protein JWM91_1604 [Rhodospirillales bacterium]|nr:hypothetical protein [Rhodospirillales bacterium]
MHKRFLLLTASLIGLACLASAAAAPDESRPTEFWKNDEQGWVVEAKPCDSGLCAYLVDYRVTHQHEPGYVARDEHNPDSARRAEPLCGLRLMGGFKPTRRSSNVWDGGWVYDPDNGRTYSGTISIIDENTVKLRGYVGISLFGRTLILHRLANAPTRCSATSVN